MGRSKSLGGAPSLEDSANSGRDASRSADGIEALAAGLECVSIGAKAKTTLDDAPEAIKNVADLLSSNKYKNILVLTGAGISCNAGIRYG
jgi:hypothetical protein